MLTELYSMHRHAASAFTAPSVSAGASAAAPLPLSVPNSVSAAQAAFPPPASVTPPPFLPVRSDDRAAAAGSKEDLSFSPQPPVEEVSLESISQKLEALSYRYPYDLDGSL